MALLNETDLAQQAGKMRLRRDENTLTVVGSGVILFGVWTVVKMVLQEINRFPEFMAELGVDELGFEETGLAHLGLDPNLLAMAVAFTVVIIVYLMDLGLRVFVGLSARAEGRGRPQGRLYLILAGLLLVLSGLSFVSYVIMYFSHSEYVVDADAAILVELTSFITLLQMIISAVRVKRARRMEKERG